MSSTENPGDGAQQVSPPEPAGPQTTTDASVPEQQEAEVIATEPESDTTASQAVTPDAGTAAAPTPEAAELPDPTSDTPAVDTPAEAAGTETAATELPPTDEPPSVAEVVDGPAAEGPAAELPAEESPAPQAPAPDTAETVAEAVDAPAAEMPSSEAPSSEAPSSEAPVPHPGPPPGPVAVVPPPSPAAEPTVSDPTEWGRVDEEGTVYVRTADGERAVGSWQAGDPAAGLAHYGRRFDDLATEVSLLEARLRAHTGNPSELKAKAQTLAESIPTASAVGDLDGLAARARAMVDTADSAAAESRAERAAARAAQVARKEALAAEAEQIANESTQWKASGDRLKAIVEEWKSIRGIDRKTDEALWARFAAARDAFGRRRGAHFAQLDAQRNEARAAKQELIAEAEQLATSTDWGPTSAAMRSLMDRWKAVPRTGRDGDDDLWKRFRAAQDVFFTARAESDKSRNAEQSANQEKKEGLLAEAEKIDPSSPNAQSQLRRIQERYDGIGHVPRAAMRGLEDRMQAVEQKIRGAADAGRARTAPENPMVASMRAAVTKAEEQLTKAEAAGDAKRIEEAQANLATRREWLAEAEKTAGRR